MAKDVTVDAGETAAILEFLPDAADLLREDAGNGNDDAAGAAGDDLPDGDGAADENADGAEGAEEAGGADGSEKDDSDDAGDEADDKGPGKAKDKVQARIDKLTARAKSAEEERDELKGKISELEAKVQEAEVAPKVVQAPTADNPLADVNDVKSLEAKVLNARAVKRWCIENPDGGSVLGQDGKEIEVDPAAARRMLADAEEVLTIHAPRRERFLAEKAGHEKVAREAYPEMFKAGSEEAKAYRSLMEAWPEITRFPDYQMVLGDYIAGYNARLKAGQKPDEAAAAAPAKRGIAPPVPKPSTQKPKPTQRGRSADRVISEGATLDAMTEYFAG